MKLHAEHYDLYLIYYKICKRSQLWDSYDNNLSFEKTWLKFRYWKNVAKIPVLKRPVALLSCPLTIAVQEKRSPGLSFTLLIFEQKIFIYILQPRLYIKLIIINSAYVVSHHYVN